MKRKRRVRRWQKKKTKEQKYLILAGNDSKLIRSQQKKAEDHANLHLKAGFCLILFLLLSPRFMLLLPVSFSFSWPLHGFLAHQHHFAHQPTSLQQHPPTRYVCHHASLSWPRFCFPCHFHSKFRFSLKNVIFFFVGWWNFVFCFFISFVGLWIRV